MVSLTKKINFFVTNTEIEALLLECNLIKKIKPRFNIILRDDKSFPYILINNEYDFLEYKNIEVQKNLKEIILAHLFHLHCRLYNLIALQKIFSC